MSNHEHHGGLREKLLLVLIGFPAVGLLMGGIYSFPAGHFTKGRDPWLTLMLAGGLACTIFGVGFLCHGSPQSATWVWLAAVVMLLVRFVFDLKNSIEHFGTVHLLALLAMLAAAF